MHTSDLFSMLDEYDRTRAAPAAPVAPPRDEDPWLIARKFRDLPSVAGIIDLLGRARDAGLRFPKLRLQLDDGTPLRLHIAGDKSRTPGYVMLTDGGGFDSGKYFGRVSPEGRLELGRDGPAVQAMLVPLLERLAQDPAAVAAEYGHLTGNCCFCKRTLNDERSTAVGYGPVCAEKFGLPWGAK